MRLRAFLSSGLVDELDITTNNRKTRSRIHRARQQEGNGEEMTRAGRIEAGKKTSSSARIWLKCKESR